MKNLPIFVSLLLFALSLANPAFYFIKSFPSSGSSAGSPAVWDGITVLLVGWLGLFFSQFGWFANPLYGLSLYFVWTGRWRSAIVSSGIAIVIAASNTVLLFRQTLWGDEAGVAKLNLHHLERGYYFWAIALSIPFVWSTVQAWRFR